MGAEQIGVRSLSIDRMRVRDCGCSFRSKIIETEAAYDDEFLKRKPIDQVWLAKEYPIRSWPLETVLQWHREMVQPKMLNSMDSFVWARLRLDMTTSKKVKQRSSGTRVERNRLF